MSAVAATAHDYAGPPGRGAPSRLRHRWRGPSDDPARARPALYALLAVTGLLYLFNVSRNGYANDFYAAAVQAGTRSWKAFFFGSFDSSNFITVDKTPASLWVDEIVARVFGFSSWTLLVPQALEGIAAVWLLFLAVRRWFGPSAGPIAEPVRRARRIWHVVVSGLAVIVGAGWWVAAAQLWPAASRPYFGGSTNNNILELALGYNGLGRVDGTEVGSIGFNGSSVGGAGFGGNATGGGTDSSAIASWVEAHYQAETVGGVTVYDLTEPS